MVEVEKPEISNAIKNHETKMVEFLSKLMKTPSVNGENNEKAIAELVAAEAKELGLPVQLMALDQERPNVFVGAKYNEKSGLLFVAHLDTVPTGDIYKWKHDPFGAEIEAGKLFGRGAIDCKAGIALSIYTLKILNDLGKPEIAKFAGVADEESGADSKLGARYLLDKGLQAKTAIYTYPGVGTVTIGHRGGVRIWVEAQGETAHTGSMSWQKKEKGANAIEAIAKFITRLPEITMSGTHPDFPSYGFVLTPTLIQGGAGESIVPDKAKVLLDARLLPNHDNEEYIGKVKKLTQELEDEKIKFNLTIKNNVPGVVISKDEPIVKILEKLDKEIMGVNPEIRGCGPWNEGYMFIDAGIPMVCGFGAEGEGVHSTDEYVKLDSLPKILEMYITAALELSS